MLIKVCEQTIINIIICNICTPKLLWNLFKYNSIAPVLGWGKYQKFEFGCCVAFNDSSPNGRSYVITMLIAMLFFPFCICLICYCIIVYTAHGSYKRMKQNMVTSSYAQVIDYISKTKYHKFEKFLLAKL